MDLIARAKADMQRITQGEFSTSVVFLNPAGDETAIVSALASSHHLAFDPDTGTQVISKNIHVSVSEKVLNDAGYTTRNAAGLADLVNHRVTWTDATGTAKTYIVNDVMPDETLGLLVLIVKTYNSGS